MPADADRPAVVEARVAAGLRAAHQEVARPVAEDQVRDHLLPGPVDLHGGARLEPALARDELLEALEAVRSDAQPARVGHDRGPRDHEHAARPSVTRPAPLGPLWVEHPSSRLEPLPDLPRVDALVTGVQQVEPGVDGVPERAQALARPTAAFVARIPAPISGSPRASRVMSRQPVAVSSRAVGQVRAPSGAGDALDQRRGEDEREMADRGDRGIVLVCGHGDGPRADRRRECLDTVDVDRPGELGWHDDPRPADEQVRGRSRDAARFPGRPSDARRRTAA